MSETEKSSESIPFSSSDWSSPPSRPWDSSSASDSSDPKDSEEDASSSGGGPGEACPGITDIQVTLYRIGSYVLPPLCFENNALTGCAVVIGFVLEPFDPVCYNYLVARVTIAGSSRTLAVYNVGGFYQVTWGFDGDASLNLFPCTEYTVSICLERSIGTPEECRVPYDCCGEKTWVSPGLCENEGECPGCTNPHAANYSPIATDDDGSCLTCASQSLCVVPDYDEGENCNNAGNGCCDEHCISVDDCSPSFSSSFLAANGTYYPSCYG